MEDLNPLSLDLKAALSYMKVRDEAVKEWVQNDSLQCNTSF